MGDRFDSLRGTMHSSLSENAERAAEHLGKLNERLAVIDSAQANLQGLASEMLSLKDVLANKQARGAYGQGRMEAILRFPLKPKLMPGDVGYSVAGRITGFASDKVVAGKTVLADELMLAANPRGMTVSGPGSIPTEAATERATVALSPVSSTGRSPRLRRSLIAVALLGFGRSATTQTAFAEPSYPTRTAVFPDSRAETRASRNCFETSTSCLLNNASPPTMTRLADTTPVVPSPGSDSNWPT